MKNSIVSGAFRTARTTILFFFISTVTLSVAFVSERLVFERSFHGASDLMLAATSVAADIKLADERLTMSANMASNSGELRWIHQYNSYLPDIDKAIRSVIAIASRQVAERFYRETKQANDALEDMERQAILAVEVGDLPRARTILDSPAYSDQKKMLADGTGHMLGSVITAAETRLESVLIIGHITLLSLLGLGMLAFALLWVLTGKSLSISETSHLDAEDKLNFMARHDELTQLPNRRTFDALLTEYLEKQKSESEWFIAVAMIDIDHFKDINDTLGHTYGDKLIRALPDRLKSGIPVNSVLARFGGDEFAMALPVQNEEQARATFKQMVDCLAAPFNIDGHLLSISISVGVALAPSHSSIPDDLLRFADIALYQAKAQGRNRMQMFDPILDELNRERLQTETDLRSALENNEFTLYYQPIFSQDGTSVTGLEALLRWHHPIHGMVSPTHFVPIAEQSGLIVKIGEWVLKRAFEDSFRWPHQRIAINLSPAQLRDSSFFGNVHCLLLETKVDPRRFDLEVTEGVLLEDNRRAHKLLDDFRALGFGISLDDFGTGYSSLSYLRNFPFTKLKIDQSFIRKIEISTESAQIVYSIIGLGRALGLSVIAEGVETIGQHRLLAAAGCQEMQGYLFAKAQPREEIDEFLSESQKRQIYLLT
ncbi:MAG: putative bifunctional diguanylate cyclase/phosphodiesterase [Pseudomonas sp.]